MIVFDLDGTLLDPQGKIHPTDIALLTSTRVDVAFVPATGRSLAALRISLGPVILTHKEPVPFPMILQNGSLVYDSNERLINFTPFPIAIQEAILQICMNNLDITYLFLGLDVIDILNPTPFGNEQVRRYHFKPDPYQDGAPGRAYSKVMCISDKPELLARFKGQAAGLKVEAALSMATIFELTPSGVNKGTGLGILAKQKKWKLENIYSVGDGENDLELFRRSGMSFAPVSSPVSIKRKVDKVIETSSEGVLSPILRHIGLNPEI